MSIKPLFFVAWLFSQIDLHQCPAADLADAVSHLEKWKGHIVSIRVRSQMTSVGETSQALRLSNVKKSVAESDWVWEDSGRFLDSMVASHDGKRSANDFQASDGKKFYATRFPSENPGSEYPANVLINAYQPGMMTSSKLDLMVMALYGQGGKSLAERLSAVPEATTTPEGLLEMDGLPLGYEGFRLVLDPSHGYLPQMLDYVDRSSGVYRHTVDEFREVETGFWFPWKGTDILNDVDVQKWEVTQVDLNTELPATLFKPKMGDETYVNDKITGKEYWYAGKPPARLVAAAKAAARPNRDLRVNDNPAIAQPERFGNWSLWLVVLGGILVSGGVWVKRRA